MFRYLAKRCIEWYWDSNSNPLSADPLPRWLRNWVDRDSTLREYENALIQLGTRLEGASESHRSSSTHSLPFEYEPFCDAARISRSRIKSTLRPSSASRWNSQQWPTWKLATLGIVCIALIAGTLTLRDAMIRTPDATALTENQPSLPNSNETRAFLKSSFAMSHRWSNRLQATKSQVQQGMQSGVAKLDTQIIDEAQTLGRQGVRFVTQEIPASAVRMFVRNRTTKP